MCGRFSGESKSLKNSPLWELEDLLATYFKQVGACSAVTVAYCWENWLCILPQVWTLKNSVADGWCLQAVTVLCTQVYQVRAEVCTLEQWRNKNSYSKLMGITNLRTLIMLPGLFFRLLSNQTLSGKRIVVMVEWTEPVVLVRLSNSHCLLSGRGKKGAHNMCLTEKYGSNRLTV